MKLEVSLDEGTELAWKGRTPAQASAPVLRLSEDRALARACIIFARRYILRPPDPGRRSLKYHAFREFVIDDRFG